MTKDHIVGHWLDQNQHTLFAMKSTSDHVAIRKKVLMTQLIIKSVYFGSIPDQILMKFFLHPMVCVFTNKDISCTKNA